VGGSLETAYLSERHTAAALELELKGRWRVASFADLDRELAALDLAGVRQVLITTERLELLDLSSAWRLRAFTERARSAGAAVEFRGGEPAQLRLLEETLALEPPQRAPDAAGERVREEPVELLGRRVVRDWHALVAGVAFVGRIALTTARALGSRKRLRITSITRHVYDGGITAIPIVALIAFLISVIIAYLSAQQLQRFGATIFVVDLVTIGVLRELGVLLTAIILAGRSGSAYAAEIGAMRLNEEVDALEATGVDPYEALVLPRVLGLTIALPLLTVIADGIGLAGGGLLCRFLLGIPLQQYLSRVNDSIASTTFWVGIWKAPVFAVLIALVGTYRGMQVTGSSRELGRLTTIAVVQAIFLVILADAVFAVLFMELDV